MILSKFLSIKFQSIHQRTISFSIKYENIKFYPVSVYLLTNGNLYSLDHSAKSKYKKVFYAIKDMKLVLAVGKCVQKHGVSELYNMSPVCLPLKLFPSEQIHSLCSGMGIVCWHINVRLSLQYALRTIEELNFHQQ